MPAVEQHFVTYYSPNIMVADESQKTIDSWDVGYAKRFAPANAYGFRFTTRGRGMYDLDSKVTATSGFYFLKGVVDTLEQIEARGRASDRILLSNMKCNGPHGRVDAAARAG